MAPDHSHIEGDFALLGVSYCRRGPGIGDRDNDVCVCRVLTCEAPSGFLSELVDVFGEDSAVLLGEIDVLEDAVGRGYAARCDEETAGDAVFVQPDYFSGLDLTDERCFGFDRGTAA